MTRNTVAIVSAVLFVVLAALLAVAPVPYVTWGPGRAYNVLATDQSPPTIGIEGVTTFPTNGQLLLSSAAVSRPDGQVSLPEALLAHWMPSSQVVPREWAYQPGKTREQLQDETTSESGTMHRDATVSALRAAGHPVTEMPMVSSVAATGPSSAKLLVGDLVSKVDGLPVARTEDVTNAIRRHAVGEDVVLEVLRGSETVAVTVTTASSNQGDRRIPVIGISTTIGYRFAPTVTFGVEPDIAGPSAGLPLALGIYDLITEGDLLGTRVVGAAGTIDALGNVGPVEAIQEKIASAQGQKATAFLVPAVNCPDVAGLRTSLSLVKVATLKDAIAAVQLLAEPNPTTEVPHC